MRSDGGGSRPGERSPGGESAGSGGAGGGESDPPSRERAFRDLRHWARERNWTGYDPYDGLNSRILRKTPLLSFKWGRIAVTQLLKHAPVNLRPALGIGPTVNPKALALFLSGSVRAYRRFREPDLLAEVETLAEKLWSERSRGWKGAGWGYPFPWQSRLFHLPARTPTIVVTSYAGNAYLDAYDLTSESRYLERGRQAGRFVLEELNRSYDRDGESFCWSYSPLDDTEVYNATLLGSRLLARLHGRTGDRRALREARASVEYVVRRQGDRGEWVYGSDPIQQWVDNFHTGFNLECLWDYVRSTGDERMLEPLETGLEFYVDEMFLPSGAPKYYADRVHPIDIHSCAQAVITLVRLQEIRDHRPLARKVLSWTLRHMRDPEGYFYFQKRALYTHRVPFMRWAQAWMYRALACSLTGLGPRGGERA